MPSTVASRATSNVTAERLRAAMGTNTPAAAKKSRSPMTARLASESARMIAAIPSIAEIPIRPTAIP